VCTYSWVFEEEQGEADTKQEELEGEELEGEDQLPPGG